MESLEILNIEKIHSGGENWIAVRVNDKKENVIFWIDCSIMDGFGNHKNFKTEDLFIDWDFNQYIFNLENEIDLIMKKYQEDYNNIDRIQYFIDEKNDYLLKQFTREDL